MLVVETIGRIRRAFFVKGQSIKEIVRDLKVSRNTVRNGDSLVFISCKSYNADIDIGVNTREKLKSALHEVDDLNDHFGRPCDQVALVTTTDLIDEDRHRVRFEHLFGKALALQVHVIGLDFLAWSQIVPRLRRIFEAAPTASPLTV